MNNMDSKTVSQMFNRLKKQNPAPTTELIYKTTFELLISVVLSAQATDISVNKATKELFATANTPEQILKLGNSDLKAYIKSIGLFNTKADNIIKLCKILIDQHNNQVPNTREALEELPGVGRKTANVILNTAFNMPTIAVDTHIYRLANRLNLAPGKTPLQVENKLLEVIPKRFLKDAHHWLILHGRYVCTARSPKCDKCIISDLCEYTGTTPICAN